jgi:asparagine synthase (glutamine-hydrolysing)
MCGVAGIAGGVTERQLVEAMCDLIVHRGPEGSGIYEDEGIVLGHRRLKVIDLSDAASQPMCNEDGSIWIAFNGEIYNFMALRRDLKASGHQFVSASDTEVVLHLYQDRGIECCRYLNGIFAFALWDGPRHRLVLARDHLGVKPMHYYFDGQRLLFASEIKCLLLDPLLKRQVNPQSLHYFLNLRYIPTNDTLFQGIYRLPPAHTLVFEEGQIRLQRFWQLDWQVDTGGDEGYYKEGIRTYLRQAVDRQLVSDVPLGVYLSGGMDSSSIVAFMSEILEEPVKTFAMGFNEPTDELDDAKIVADHFGTEHHAISLSLDPLKHMPEGIWYTEEPQVNLLQSYLLAQYARQFVTVSLDGLGGDELFAGYINNNYMYPSQPFHRLVPRVFTDAVLTPLSSLVFRLQMATGIMSWEEYRRGVQMLLSLGDRTRYYLILRNVWDYDSANFEQIYGQALRGCAFDPVSHVFEPYFARDGMDFLDQALVAELETKMINDFLLSGDRVSMANSLEVRVPFLDVDLVNFAFSIPTRFKIKNNRTKYIFRQAMAGILPDPIIRKKKWGFSFNPYYQFQKDLKTVAERVLTRERVLETGFFNYDFIRQVVEHRPHPRLRWHYFVLWMMVGFHIWHDMFITGDVRRPIFDLESYCHV